MTSRIHYAGYISLLAVLAGNCSAAQPNRVTQPLKLEQIRVIPGNLHPLAQPRYDQGAVEPSLQMDHVLVLFQPTPSQQADLDQLLAAQQNPSSPDYHRWLTPDDFADRFGLSTADHSRVISWLNSQGLT